MTYLILAILFSTALSLVLRVAHDKTDNTYGIYFINYIICTALSIIYLNGSSSGIITNPIGDGGSALILGGINGALYLLGLMYYQGNIVLNGTGLSAAFSRLGVIMPVLAAVLFLNEILTLAQSIGIFFAILAVLLMSLPQKTTSKKIQILPLLLLLMVSGASSIVTKLFQMNAKIGYTDVYLIAVFSFAIVFTLFPLLKSKKKIKPIDIIIGLGVGIPNYYNSKFLLYSLEELQSSVVFPVFAVGTILLITIISRLLFGDKLSTRQKFGLAIIIIAVALLNL